MDKEFYNRFDEDKELDVYGVAKGKDVLIKVFRELLKESAYFATRGLWRFTKGSNSKKRIQNSFQV